MVEANIVLTLLQTVSIMVGIGYYILNIQNNQKNQIIALKNQELTLKTQEQAVETRQAQIFMGIYETWRSPSFREVYNKMRIREWKDFDDWQARYSPSQNTEEGTNEHIVFTFFDGVGVLIRRGLMDIGLVDELMSASFIDFWEKFREVIGQVRDNNKNPRIFKNSEYLYEEILQYRKETKN